MIKELIKEILKEELLGKAEKTESQLPCPIRNVMIRTYSAGVHFGEITYHRLKEVKLVNAQRVYYWKGACSLSQLAMDGSKERSECKISKKVDSIILTEAIEIIDMTHKAYQNLAEGVIWEK